MSDCSTNAMKPKEPPKTCGNCGKCVAIVGHCDDNNDRVDLYDQSCENWTPRTDDLEPTCDACPERLPEDGCKVKAHCYDLQQRCQQLEQVARDMFNHMQGLDDILRKNAHDEYMRTDGKAVIGDIADRLEALGVTAEDWRELGKMAPRLAEAFEKYEATREHASYKPITKRKRKSAARLKVKR